MNSLVGANLSLDINGFAAVDMREDTYQTLIGTNTTGRYDVTPLFADSDVYGLNLR